MVHVQYGWSDVLVKFDYAAPYNAPYLYHCHILEHEDCGMMGQFTVTWFRRIRKGWCFLFENSASCNFLPLRNPIRRGRFLALAWGEVTDSFAIDM